MRYLAITSFLILSFFSSIASDVSDNEFYVHTTFFEGEKVLFFSESRGGAVVLLEDRSIYLMNKAQEFTEVTDLFTEEVLLDVSCVEAVNERAFYVGTSAHGLYLYEDGQVTHINALVADLPLQINSIDFGGGATDLVKLATSSNVFTSFNLKDFWAEPVNYTTDTRFYSGRGSILQTDISDRLCYRNSGSYGIRREEQSNIISYKILESDFFEVSELNDIAYLQRAYGHFPRNRYAYYAMDGGLYAQHISSCSTDTVVHLIDQAVYDLEVVGAGLPVSVLFMATDQGLLFQERRENSVYFEVHEPTFYEVSGIASASVVTYGRYHQVIWVGTDDGLVQVLEDDLDDIEFTLPTITKDTVESCLYDEAYLSVDVDEVLDPQWYKDNEPIEGAISNSLYTEERGLYSIGYTLDGQSYLTDVSLVRLDSIFNERIVVQDYLLCDRWSSAYIYVTNYDDDHSYSWYSVERGFEYNSTRRSFRAEQGGHYYFVATNCSDYNYVSDTITVNESSLTDISFKDWDYYAEDKCSGDTVWVEGAETAVRYTWRVDYDRIPDYDEPYYVVKYEDARDRLYVEVMDEHGCQQSYGDRIGQVYSNPYLSADELVAYICEEEAFVEIDVPYRSQIVWEGIEDGRNVKVGEGTYPVTISNGVCEDFNGNVEVKYHDPAPYIQDSYHLETGDTLKIPLPNDSSVFTNGEVVQTVDGSYVHFASTDRELIHGYIGIPADACTKGYEFTVHYPVITSIEGNRDTGLKVYPNPTEGRVIIASTTKSLASVRLTGLNGKVIHEVDYGNPVQQSSFSFVNKELNKGIYLLNVTYQDNTSAYQRIMVE